MLLSGEPEWLFPFQDMHVGESFFIPTVKPSAIIYTIDTAAKKEKVRVKCYTVVYEGLLGVRTWRTE
jgi:hypothetical protein